MGLAGPAAWGVYTSACPARRLALAGAFMAEAAGPGVAAWGSAAAAVTALGARIWYREGCGGGRLAGTHAACAVPAGAAGRGGRIMVSAGCGASLGDCRKGDLP